MNNLPETGVQDVQDVQEVQGVQEEKLSAEQEYLEKTLKKIEVFYNENNSRIETFPYFKKKNEELIKEIDDNIKKESEKADNSFKYLMQKLKDTSNALYETEKHNHNLKNREKIDTKEMEAMEHSILTIRSSISILINDYNNTITKLTEKKKSIEETIKQEEKRLAKSKIFLPIEKGIIDKIKSKNHHIEDIIEAIDKYEYKKLSTLNKIMNIKIPIITPVLNLLNGPFYRLFYNAFLYSKGDSTVPFKPNKIVTNWTYAYGGKSKKKRKGSSNRKKTLRKK